MNRYEFGKCLKIDQGSRGCYVHLPSNCKDLRASRTDPGKFTSFQACDHCKQPDQFYCLDENKCIDLIERCNGHCVKDRWYCKVSKKCIAVNIPCEKKCDSERHFCKESGKCISRIVPCGTKCLNPDFAFICDNFTQCLNNEYVNNDRYECVDRTDEHPGKNQRNERKFVNEATINKLIQIFQKQSVIKIEDKDDTQLQEVSDTFQVMVLSIKTTDK